MFPPPFINATYLVSSISELIVHVAICYTLNNFWCSYYVIYECSDLALTHSQGANRAWTE